MLRFLNCVVLAEDYEALRDWWIAFGLEVHREWPDLPYTDLALDGTVVLGIAPLPEDEEQPASPRRNTTFPQFVTDDVAGLMAHVVAIGGEIAFGPAHAQDGGYWYGAFDDLEGNRAWVVSPEAAG
jgi:predicted enzyme related to lactoylglutathione lyase